MNRDDAGDGNGDDKNKISAIVLHCNSCDEYKFMKMLYISWFDWLIDSLIKSIIETNKIFYYSM